MTAPPICASYTSAPNILVYQHCRSSPSLKRSYYPHLSHLAACISSAALSTIAMAGMLGIIIVGASTLATVVGMMKIPTLLSETVLAADLGRMIVWLLIVLLYLVLGCFMDGISLMLLTVPVTYPVIVGAMGFNGIWFGVLVTMLVECALITPPVGMNLYVLQGVTGQKDLMNVIYRLRACAPGQRANFLEPMGYPWIILQSDIWQILSLFTLIREQAISLH